MDAPATASVNVTIRFNRFLPYWAVLQTDLRQTVRSWVYRLWVLLVLAAAVGSILYKFGAQREAGIVQTASVQTGDLLRGLVAASLALVALFAVRSRGISRHQYFLAKWHARLVVVLGTFVVLAAVVLTAHHFLFDSDLSLA